MEERDQIELCVFPTVGAVPSWRMYHIHLYIIHKGKWFFISCPSLVLSVEDYEKSLRVHRDPLCLWLLGLLYVRSNIYSALSNLSKNFSNISLNYLYSSRAFLLCFVLFSLSHPKHLFLLRFQADWLIKPWSQCIDGVKKSCDIIVFFFLISCQGQRMLISAASYKIEAESFCVYVIKRLVLSIVIIDKVYYK